MATTAFTPQQASLLQPLSSVLGDTVRWETPNTFVKPRAYGDWDAVQSKLGEYDVVDRSALGGLTDYYQQKALASTPLSTSKYLKGSPALGNKLFFSKGGVDQISGGLSGLDETALSSLSPLLSGVNAVGSNAGSTFYEKEALKNQLGKYRALSDTELSELRGRGAKDVNPLASYSGSNFFNPETVAAAYDSLPFVGRTIKGVNVLGSGNPYALFNDTDPYLMQHNFNDPRGMSAGGTYYADPWGFSHQAERVAGTPYYFIPESNFEPTRSGTALTWYGINDPTNIYGYEYGGRRGYAFDPTKVDISSRFSSGRNNDLYAEKKGGGLFGSVFGFLDPILDKIDPLHNLAQNLVTKGLGFDSQEQVFGTIMPMVVDYFLPGVGSGLSAANAASTGNWGGALTGALGAYTGLAGAGLNMTGNAVLDQALTKAAISGAGTAVSGGKMQDVLRNAALSGLTSYGSGALGGAMKGASPLVKMAANTGYGTAVGGLSSALQGKGFSRGATNAARREVTNAAINAALNSQLYKGLV